jgi:hypothetical protein
MTSKNIHFDTKVNPRKRRISTAEEQKEHENVHIPEIQQSSSNHLENWDLPPPILQVCLSLECVSSC